MFSLVLLATCRRHSIRLSWMKPCGGAPSTRGPPLCFGMCPSALCRLRSLSESDSLDRTGFSVREGQPIRPEITAALAGWSLHSFSMSTTQPV